MKKAMFTVLAICFTASMAWATPGYTPSTTPGCYDWAIQGPIMVVNTSQNLTVDKTSTAKSEAQMKKVCNDLGKSLYGHLMKYSEIANVIISARQIAIVKFKLPKTWKQIEPDILSILDGVLCGTPVKQPKGKDKKQ